VDLRVGRQDAEGTPWSVLSDLAITIVLVLVVYIVLQFVQTFRERAINAELVKRQATMRQAIESAIARRWEVRVDSQAPDRQRVTFSSELLFEPCKAVLKPDGEALLRALGEVLGREAGVLEAIQVEGHTDSLPVRRQGTGCPYPSNWELSSARATRVVTLFSAQNLVASPKLSAIGRAEFHPVVKDALDPNRRIELILLYDRRQVAHAISSTKNDSRLSLARRMAPGPSDSRSLSGPQPPAPIGVPNDVEAKRSSAPIPGLIGPSTDPDTSLELLAIRRIYDEVEAALRSGLFDDAVDEVSCSIGFISAYRDSIGVIRKLELSAQSEHVFARADYYYDADGGLRFSFRRFKADNGTNEETRVYFGPVGVEIHRDVRRLTGPGFDGGFTHEVDKPDAYIESCR
jgi:outer membrane protein OmpA-like peptidoglycan-associated protein